MVKNYKNLARDTLVNYGNAIAQTKNGYNAATASTELTKQFGDAYIKGTYLEYLADYCNDPELKQVLETASHFLSSIDQDVIEDVKNYLYDTESLS